MKEVELECKHNVHGYPDKVNIRVDSDNVYLTTSTMEHFYITQTVIMTKEEFKNLLVELNFV